MLKASVSAAFRSCRKIRELSGSAPYLYPALSLVSSLRLSFLRFLSCPHLYCFITSPLSRSRSRSFVPPAAEALSGKAVIAVPAELVAVVSKVVRRSARAADGAFGPPVTMLVSAAVPASSCCMGRICIPLLARYLTLSIPVSVYLFPQSYKLPVLHVLVVHVLVSKVVARRVIVGYRVGGGGFARKVGGSLQCMLYET